MAKNNTVEKRNSILGMSFFGPALVLMAYEKFRKRTEAWKKWNRKSVH